MADLPQDQEITIGDINGNNHLIKASNIEWRPSAYAIVIRDKQVLLAKQQNKYTLPGGGIEIYESLNEGLKREVLEETGITINNIKQFCFDECYFLLPEANQSSPVHSLLFFYSADYFSGEISTNFLPEDEQGSHSDAEWVSLDNVGGVKIYGTYDWRKVVMEYYENHRH